MVVLFPTPQSPYLSQKSEIIAPSVISKSLDKIHPYNHEWGNSGDELKNCIKQGF